MAEPTINLGNGNWAGKSDNLLGYYKEGERFYKQEFTFSRSTSGTRVNSSGLIETAEILGNELVTNGTFSGVANGTDVVTLSGWGTYGSVTSRNIESEQLKLVSPSGTTNVGVVLSVSTTSGGLYRFTYSASGDLGINGIYIDAVGGYNTSTEQDITFTAPSSTTYIYFRTGANNGGTAYFDNISVKEAFQVNIPRVDYLNNSNGSLILEPQRTNAINYSNDYTLWSNTQFTINGNSITSPEGITNGTKIVPSTSNTDKYLDKGGFIRTSGQYITHTVYAKASGYNFLYLSNSASRLYAVYDLQQGLVIYNNSNGTDFNNHSASIELFGNGWYRCKLIGQAQSSTASYFRISCGITAINSSTSGLFQGDGTSGIEVYGSQVELNASYPTTLINTSGSSVTRNADACSLTNVADRIGQTEGTIYVDVNILSILGNEAIVGVNSGGYTNHATIQRVGNTIQFVRNSATQSGATIVTSSAINIGSHKIAIAYKSGDTACFLNGTQVSTTQTQTFTNGTLNTLRLGADAIGSIPINGLFNNAIIYSQRLSNTELATLTT